MPSFFSVSDNTLSTRGYPWIGPVVEGLTPLTFCIGCRGPQRYVNGKIRVLLERRKGTKWPDALGGAYFIVSQKVIDCWDVEGIGAFPIQPVKIAEPYPKKLEGTKPPKYFWIDGRKLNGALVDFQASGYVIREFCSECGRRIENISETFKRQYARGVEFSYVFQDDTWHGLNLFTTDISDRKFFCTEKIVECARKYRLTNFRFIPIEEGGAFGSKGLKYM